MAGFGAAGLQCVNGLWKIGWRGCLRRSRLTWQREGLSLSALQASLRGRSRGTVIRVNSVRRCIGMDLSDGGTEAGLKGLKNYATSSNARYSTSTFSPQPDES
jgi:hypothetical protein